MWQSFKIYTHYSIYKSSKILIFHLHQLNRACNQRPKPYSKQLMMSIGGSCTKQPSLTKYTTLVLQNSFKVFREWVAANYRPSYFSYYNVIKNFGNKYFFVFMWAWYRFVTEALNYALGRALVYFLANFWTSFRERVYECFSHFFWFPDHLGINRLTSHSAVQF